MHTKQAAYRTYVVGARSAADASRRLCTGTRQTPTTTSACSARQRRDDLLIVGGEDHKTGQADDADERFARLEAWARAAFSRCWGRSTTAGRARSWSRSTASPSSAAIPGDDDNVFIATGDSGNGMTHGTIAGMLITDLIVGRANPGRRSTIPSRKTLRAAPASS